MENGEGESRRESSIPCYGLEVHQDSDADSDSDAKSNAAEVTNTFYQSKWQRLKKYYNDDYLRLFNQTHEDDVEVQASSNFETSQIGAVIWTSHEKELLFRALSRTGRHDLAFMANEITTKSEIEIRDYIDTLHDAHVDRQRFCKKTKQISYPQLPAAVEIGEQCEHALERAADALSAFQEQYDLTTAQQNADGPGIIDYTTALRLDAENDAAEAELDSLQDEEEVHVPSNTLFILSKWLELSESIFMNQPADSHYQHWTQLADTEQRPSLTADVVKTFRDLVVSLTQRVIQVSIFMAKSRLRSMTRDHYTPARSLTKSDVSSALDVLGVTQNSWKYWKTMARRNGLQVISGSHSKGQSALEDVPYDLVEAFLSPRKSRKRSRSVSSGSDISSASEFVLANKAVASVESVESEAEVDSDPASSEERTDTSETDSAENSDSTSVHEQPDKEQINPAQRLRLFKQAQDDQAERLDKQAREREEHMLRQVLRGEDGSESHSQRDQSAQTAFRTMRKTNDDLQLWSCRYQAEWESLRRMSGEEFRKMRSRKRVKPNDSDAED